MVLPLLEHLLSVNFFHLDISPHVKGGFNYQIRIVCDALDSLQYAVFYYKIAAPSTSPADINCTVAFNLSAGLGVYFIFIKVLKCSIGSDLGKTSFCVSAVL